MVNIKRYDKDYPSNIEKIFQGSSYIEAEIKATVFDGIEFYIAMQASVYKNPDGKLSFKGNKNEEVFEAYTVRVVPYERIDLVDLIGDEFQCLPLLYCHFKKKTNWNFWKRSPFSSGEIYYKKSEFYHVDSDHPNMELTLIRKRISKK